MDKPKKKISTRKAPPKRGATADKLSVKEKKQQIRKQKAKEKRKSQRRIQQLAKQVKKDRYAADLRKKEKLRLCKPVCVKEQAGAGVCAV